MPDLQPPFGAGVVTVPDELVDKYRAEGWSLIEDEEPSKPAAKRTPAKSKSQ